MNVTGQLYLDFFLAMERIDNFYEVCGECQDNTIVTINEVEPLVSVSLPEVLILTCRFWSN